MNQRAAFVVRDDDPCSPLPIWRRHLFVVYGNDEALYRCRESFHRRRLVRRTSPPHLRPSPLEGSIAAAGIIAVCRVGHVEDFNDLTVVQLHL